MFKKLRLKLINGRIARVHNKMAYIYRKTSSGDWLASAYERKLDVLHKKLIQLKDKESALKQSKSSLINITGEKLFRWTCFYALVCICIVCFAGCVPVEADASDSDVIGTISDKRLSAFNDNQYGIRCYVLGSSTLSCVPMKD